MPEPDGQMPDGTPAYTPVGFRKVQEWQKRQTKNEVMAAVKEQYGWVDEAKKAHDTRQAEIPRVRSQIADARKNWEDFEPNVDAILAELQADSQAAERAGREPQLTLHDAYRIVIGRVRKAERDKHAKELETLKTDRNKMREDVLKELNQRPHSTATVPTTPVARTDAADDNAKDTKDLIRDSIARLRSNG